MQAQGAAPAATLLDSTSGTARAYGAKTTPHMFVVDPGGTDHLRRRDRRQAVDESGRREDREQLRPRSADRGDVGQAGHRRRAPRRTAAASSTDALRTAAAAIAAVLVVAGCGPEPARPLQGYVEGEYVRVAAPFAGTLLQLSVKRGDEVAAAAPLFALERENEAAARREAEERLRAAEARLANLQTGKRPPEIETAAEQLQQAQRDARAVGGERATPAAALREAAS